MTETKTFTLGEFIDAMERNGFQQAFGGLFKDEDGEFIGLVTGSPEGNEDRPIVSACALGQGLINLGITWTKIAPSDYDGELIEREVLPSGFSATVVHYNDTRHMSIPKIAYMLRMEYADRLDEQFEAPKIEYNVDEKARIG